jgi:hypothetical protein
MRSNLSTPAWLNLVRANLTQGVPASAAPGIYAYRAVLREHSTWVLLDEDSFPFQKEFGEVLTGDDQDWYLLGWDDSETHKLPDHFSLEMPYPNPFNPSTAISYQLSALSQVSLRVYDTAGRLVATLVDGCREAGEHQVTFDGSKLASGLYFVRMQAGEFLVVQKIVLMK